MMVFIYSGIFHYENSNYLVPSFHDSVTGTTTLSTGLSRSFSAIVRLEFEIAHSFNPYGLRIFLFFVELLLLRIVCLFISSRYDKYLIGIIKADAILSALLFVIHFWPFFKETFEF